MYDNLNHDEALAMAIDKEITGTRKDSWRWNLIKEREVRNAVEKYIADEEEAKRIFELVKNQGDY